MYIKSYSEPVVYSGIFRTIDIFSQFQARNSGTTQEQFMINMLTLNSEPDSGIFKSGLSRHACSGIFTKLHSWLHLSRNTFQNSGMFQ